MAKCSPPAQAVLQSIRPNFKKQPKHNDQLGRWTSTLLPNGTEVILPPILEERLSRLYSFFLLEIRVELWGSLVGNSITNNTYLVDIQNYLQTLRRYAVGNEGWWLGKQDPVVFNPFDQNIVNNQGDHIIYC